MDGSVGIYWVETRHAVKHLMMYRITPTTKNYPVRNVSNVAVEKPWSRVNTKSWWLFPFLIQEVDETGRAFDLELQDPGSRPDPDPN